MSVLGHLQPALVWKHFEAICAIPHPSKHEEALANHIVGIATRLGLEVEKDEVGNVIVRQPATPGHENAPILVLQGHIDMVGVASEGVEHDFLKDPIRPRIEGEFVRATGTTLGADNGIGAAIMLAVMEDHDLVHPALEHLFTVDEEEGMVGAHHLEPGFVHGRRLINLDTEEFGQYYVSCAGGGDSVLTLRLAREAATPGFQTLHVKVGGLKGGHSGADIHLGRGSANKILAGLLDAARSAAPIRIRTLSGGAKRNSIADKAAATFDVATNGVDAVREALAVRTSLFSEMLKTTDPGLSVQVATGDPRTAAPFGLADSNRAIDLLVAVPHGVLAMSPSIEGLVETSTNVGTLETEGDAVKICMLSRSADNAAVVLVKEQIRTLARLVGAEVEEPRGYPGWKPNMDSELLKVGKRVFRDLYGQDPLVKAVHAGLECGLFGVKLPGSDMISIGPSMAQVHSPAEELFIPDVPRFYTLLARYMEALA